MNKQINRYTGQGPKGSQVQELRSCDCRYATLLAHRCINNPAAPGTLYYWNVLEAFLTRHDQLLIPCPAPLPSLKIPNFSSWLGISGDQSLIQEAIKMNLIRTKDVLITQEISKNVGAQCQMFLLLRKLQRSERSMLGIGVKDLILEQSFSQQAYLQGVRSSVSGTKGRNKYMCIFFY